MDFAICSLFVINYNVLFLVWTMIFWNRFSALLFVLEAEKRISKLII
jgi:hypothetical protein